MLTAEKVIAAVRELAAENPGTVYEQNDMGNCYYTKGRTIGGNGSCGCIVGQAIIRVCPELKDRLAKIDEDEIVPSAYNLISHLGASVEQGEKDWLFKVQLEQDCGLSWGRAVKTVDDSYDAAD